MLGIKFGGKIHNLEGCRCFAAQGQGMCGLRSDIGSFTEPKYVRVAINRIVDNSNNLAQLGLPQAPVTVPSAGLMTLIGLCLTRLIRLIW